MSSFSIHERKLLIRSFYDNFWSRGDASLAKAIFSQDVIICDVAADWPQGVEGVLALAATWRAGFPDMNERALVLTAEGDHVLAFFEFTGTHLGPYQGILPTGKTITMLGADCFKFVGDKVSEWSFIEDRLSLFSALGARLSTR